MNGISLDRCIFHIQLVGIDIFDVPLSEFLLFRKCKPKHLFTLDTNF